MNIETKLLIDCLSLLPEYLTILRKFKTVEDVEMWIFSHEKDLVRFGEKDEWERTKFYAAVNYGELFRWIKGEVYV